MLTWHMRNLLLPLLITGCGLFVSAPPDGGTAAPVDVAHDVQARDPDVQLFDALPPDALALDASAPDVQAQDVVSVDAQIATDAGADAWFDDQFALRRRYKVVPISGADEENFPLRLTIGDVPGAILAVVVADGDAALATYDRRGPSADGSEVVYVSIARMGEQPFFVDIYTDGETTHPNNPAEVWRQAGYERVFHLDEFDNHGTLDSVTGQHLGQGAVAVVEGHAKGAFSFDGDSDAYDLGPMATDDWTALTVDLWFNADAEEQQGYLLAKTPGTNAANDVFSLSMSNNARLRGRVATDAQAGRLAETPNDAIRRGQWQHVALRWPAPAHDEFEIYVDGTKKDDATVQSASLRDSAAAVTLGVPQLDVNGTNAHFHGLIDEVRISATVRSASWIQMQANNDDMVHAPRTEIRPR